MKNFRIFLVLALLFILERVFFTRFEIFSLVPWLMFAFCLTAAAIRDELGMLPVVAGLCGLAVDLAGGGAEGSAAAVYALCVLGVHVTAVRIFRESIPVSIAFIFVFSMLGEMLYCKLNYSGVDWIGVILSIILPLAIINTVFSALLYPLARILFRERRGVV